MGSIVVVDTEEAIIDGQQRLSSLTLLLMYLNNRLHASGDYNSKLESMIFSERFGVTSFNINVEERYQCMEAIFHDQANDFDATGASESVKNLRGRYMDIADLFPVENIPDDVLLHFFDWLSEKVFFVRIGAVTEQDAHKIFVSMNDRGLSLTHAEMLKGYLLSEITDDDKRNKLTAVWESRINALNEHGKNEDNTFIRTWLRAQYADTIRKNKAGAVKEDFDIISGAFHNWILDEHIRLGLVSGNDYEHFIREFEKFSRLYLNIREAEKKYADSTRYIFFNAQVEFTFQAQLLLAPICFDDSERVILQKFQLTARFIDLLIFSRVVNGQSLRYDNIKDYMFDVTRKIRRCTIPELKTRLFSLSEELKDTSSVMQDFILNRNRRKYIKNIIARIMDLLDQKQETAPTSRYATYLNFEIEHILCNHHELFAQEFPDEQEFTEWRNSIGALLLLPKKVNASLKDSAYKEKLDAYISADNLYTKSLCEQAYHNNPSFKRFISDNNLLFKPYAKFGRQEIEERIRLVTQLAAMIWNSEMFR